jgi:hypothetical protein
MVTIKSIYSGSSAAGYTVQKYNTTYDYPYDYDYDLTGLNGDFTKAKGVDFTRLADGTEKDYMMLPTPYFSYNCNKTWLSQGFRFIVNKMNGMPKEFRTYGGIPNGANYLISSQSFEYYKPGEKVKALKYDAANHLSPFSNDYFLPGKEEDVCMEMNRITDMTFDFNFNIDLLITISMTPIVWVTVGGFQVNFNDASTATHTTSKVLYYPAILKKKTIYADGISHVTENLAFNHETGQPIVTKTYDGYDREALSNSVTAPVHDGAYYNLNMPASWFYPDMGRKSSQSTNANTLNLMAGNITTYGVDANGAEADLSNAAYLNGPSATNKILTNSVVKASVNTYSKTAWTDPTVAADYGITNPNTYPFVYSPYQSFAYSSFDVVSPNPTAALLTSRVWSGGVLSSFDVTDILSANFFNGTTLSNANWQLVSQVTKTSPNGEALEEKNALGIYSSARYGYHKNLPTIVGQNAQYNNLVFESFEDEEFSGNSNLVSSYKHTGFQLI